MRKGESVISTTMAIIVVVAILAVQQKWKPASLKDVASTAEQFFLETTGISGQIPEIQGYDKVKTFRLRWYRAALYRTSPAPLVFAPGHLIIYNRDNHAVFKLETLEGSQVAWTELYDFAGRRGLTAKGRRNRPDYTRSLTGNGEPDIIVGQYSGGDHCCTTATIVELREGAVKALGKIEGLDGLPFEGLELHRTEKDQPWEIIAHRPARTVCGSHEDAADLLSVYAYADGQYTDQTNRFTSFLESVLRQNLAKWTQGKSRSLQLMQTLAANYASLGQRDQATRFFEMNLQQFLPELEKKGVNPTACLEEAKSLVENLSSAWPQR